MIEQAVMLLAVADPSILDRLSRPVLGPRIYLGAMPQGTSIDGGTIIVNKITADYDYALDGQVPSTFATVQVDCYDLEPDRADSLGQLVGVLLVGDGTPNSGFAGEAGNATVGQYEIESIQIASERVEYEKPKGASDDWRPRHHRDYRIHFQEVD